MKLRDISFNSIRRRKAKMTFLILGLVIAVGTVVALNAIAEMMNADISAKLDEYGSNILIVPKSDELSLTYGGMNVSGVSFDMRELHEEDIGSIRTIKNRENISIVAPKLINATKIQRRDVLVVGVDFDAELRLKKWWKIIGTRPGDDGEAIVGADAGNALGLSLDQPFDINGKSFRLVGILEPTGSQDDGVVFINLGQAQQLFGKLRRLSLIEMAALCYDCPIEEIVRQTSEKLPGAKVMAIRQTIESKMQAMHSFEHFSFGISCIVLVVGALIVFTNVTASVNERRREIGIFRAIGFRQTHIMSIILLEVLVASVGAGLIGYGAGLGAARFVGPLLGIHVVSLSLNYMLLGFSIGLAVVVGVVASLYPAFRASHLDPTVALRAL